MAQSATKERALPGIEPFLEKPTLEPPLRWDRWHIMLKLAIMAKEGISIDILLEDPPDKFILPPEPIYEDNVENSTSQSERDRRIRNEQLKNSWLNRCQKIDFVETLCGEKPWKYCHNKATYFRKLIKETRTAKNALEIAMNIEMGTQNQLKISGISSQTTSNEISNTTVNNVQGSWNRSRPSTNQFVKPTICPNCGYGWSASHRQNCPARGKNCKNCVIANTSQKFVENLNTHINRNPE